jgi:hypothetical protein
MMLYFSSQLHFNESQSSFTTPRQIQCQIVVVTFRVDHCCASMEYALDQMHFTWTECDLYHIFTGFLLVNPKTLKTLNVLSIMLD